MDEYGGFRPTYGVELLYAQAPLLSKPDLLRSLKKRCPRVEPLGESLEGPLAFVHPDHLIELKDATIPAQTIILASDDGIRNDFTSALQQSWSFPDAQKAVARCNASVLVTDLMSSGLPYRERHDLFTRCLVSVMEVVPPDAIHWMPAQRIVNPFSYLRASRESPTAQFFAGSVNVRLFNISGTDGDLVMDTMGLAALGLPDLQVHFHGLEANDVAQFLYDLSLYIFESGDVIEDGHTVEGLESGSKWRAQHEESLIEPKREVLDINPGKPYAAGKR